MVNVLSNNFCIRCGKKRIVIRTYTKKVGNSSVVYTKTACPDPECQKKVDEENKKDYLKRKSIKDKQAKKEKERKKRSAQSRRNKTS
jgi:hypothetical protein